MKTMTVRLADVKANPYRNIGTYHLQPARVNALRESIQNTGFWNNVIGRVNTEGDFEIAYGHHRLEAAIQELGADHQHDFVVQDIPDFMMAQIMFSENSEDWGNTVEQDNLAVSEVRDMLNEYCETYPTWDEALAGELHGITGTAIKKWFGNSGAYVRACKDGVGARTIAAFLKTTRAKVSNTIALLPKTQKELDRLQKEADEKLAEKKAKEKELADAQKELEEAQETLNAAEEKAKEEQIAQIEKELDEADEEAFAVIDELEEAGHWNPKAGEVFEKSVHAKTFREIVTADEYREFLPVNSQLAFAKKLIKAHTTPDDGLVLSVAKARNWLWDQFNKAQPENLPVGDPMARYKSALAAVASRTTDLQRAHDELLKQMKSDGLTHFPVLTDPMKNAITKMVNVGASMCRKFDREPMKLDRGYTQSGSLIFKAGSTFERPIYEDDLRLQGILDDQSTLESVGFWAKNVGDSVEKPQQRAIEHIA